jgi:hypothetical protein
MSGQSQGGTVRSPPDPYDADDALHIDEFPPYNGARHAAFAFDDEGNRYKVSTGDRIPSTKFFPEDINARIYEQLPDRPKGPNLLEIGPGEIEHSEVVEHNEAMASWQQERNELEERYGNPHEYARRLEVDHIQPITDGGHPFDPANLQTLCSTCHTEKTSTEASARAQTPGRNELNQSLFEYVATDEEVDL